MKRLALALVLIAGQAMGVQPDEVLDDPALEARAREISRDLRCPICQSENIDESNAGVSRDLRLVVRERLMAGDTDSEVFEFVVARYGEYVLFKPTFGWGNAALWMAPLAFLLVGGAVSYSFIRRRASLSEGEALSAQEAARLAALLKDTPKD
ncbi:MAG: cytochrome c-type biogenesis protein [Pseudomonadota bacterium]